MYRLVIFHEVKLIIAWPNRFWGEKNHVELCHCSNTSLDIFSVNNKALSESYQLSSTSSYE